MKSGYLSHRCTIGDSTYSQHIIYIDNISKSICSVEAFNGETPHTIFCDGWLIAFAPTIDADLSLFVKTLQLQFIDNPTLTITEALNENSLYAKHRATMGATCHIYSIPSVDWSRMQPTSASSLQLHKIL